MRALTLLGLSIAVLLTSLWPCIAQEKSLAALDPSLGVVFPPGLAPELLHQCSRPGPKNVIGYWIPEPSDISELESQLASVLAAALARSAHAPARNLAPIEFYRQYVGIIQDGGKRLIYINGFHSSFVQSKTQWLEEEKLKRPERLAKIPEANRGSNWWHVVPGKVCDGGEWFFGAEYDPDVKEIRNLYFNGHA